MALPPHLGCTSCLSELSHGLTMPDWVSFLSGPASVDLDMLRSARRMLRVTHKKYPATQKMPTTMALRG
jgi:hypothetical protein